MGSRLWAAMAAGRLANARRDPRGVVAAFEPVLALEHLEGIENPGVQPWEALYVEGLVKGGQLEDAEGVLCGLDERLGPDGLQSARGDAARVRGMLEAARGRHPQAEEAFASSIAVL